MNGDIVASHSDGIPPECASCWKEFRDILDDAIINVPEGYFRVKRFQDDDPEPRERAYCYELYHQLRARVRKDFPYTLHGEVDKAGHSAIRDCFGPRARPNPDFIVHKPTLMGCGDNLVIMEVKASDESENAINDDLHKIQIFLKRVGYVYGVMLFFGASTPKPVTPIAGIEFLWHRGVGEKPVSSKNGRFD